MMLSAPLVLFVLLLQDDPAALVERLRSDSIAERDEAVQKLKKLGRSARPALENLARTSNRDVASLAKFLLRWIELRESFPPRVVAAVPDALDQLAAGDDATWTEVLLRAVERGENSARRHQEITRTDLEPLIIRAVKGARSSHDKMAICDEASRWHLPSAAASIAELLADDDMMVRARAASTLGSLEARDQAVKLLPLLHDEPVVTQSAIDALLRLRCKEHAREILPLLKDPHPGVREEAVTAVGRMRVGTIDEVLPLLDDPVDQTRRGAVAALGSIGATSQLARIAALLEDPSPGMRAQAASTLARLNAKSHTAAIARLLSDENDFVRGAAAEALGSVHW